MLPINAPLPFYCHISSVYCPDPTGECIVNHVFVFHSFSPWAPLLHLLSTALVRQRLLGPLPSLKKAVGPMALIRKSCRVCCYDQREVEESRATNYIKGNESQ